MKEFRVGMRSGRELLVREDGDPQGLPVFALHGTPGCRIQYGPLCSDATSKGIRLISYDRPGYGGSSVQPGRSIGDTAEDVAAIADHLRLDRFGVWGHSGGGAPALACAALLGDRVVGVASLSGVAPYPAEGLDWIAGTGELNEEDFRLMLEDRAAWEEKSRHDRDEMIRWSPEELREGLATLCADVDRQELTDEFANFLVHQGREALRPGDEGMRDDNLSVILPWGFDITKIHVPVQIWHGELDRFVPVSHGRWVSAHIPGAEVHIEPKQGHLTMMVHRIPQAHSWLASKF